MNWTWTLGIRNTSRVALTTELRNHKLANKVLVQFRSSLTRKMLSSWDRCATTGTMSEPTIITTRSLVETLLKNQASMSHHCINYHDIQMKPLNISKYSEHLTIYVNAIRLNKIFSSVCWWWGVFYNVHIECGEQQCMSTSICLFICIFLTPELGWNYVFEPSALTWFTSLCIIQPAHHLCEYPNTLRGIWFPP